MENLSQDIELAYHRSCTSEFLAEGYPLALALDSYQNFLRFRWKVERKKVCSYTYYKLFPFKVVLSKKGKALETPICTARSISSMTKSPIFDR